MPKVYDFPPKDELSGIDAADRELTRLFRWRRWRAISAVIALCAVVLTSIWMAVQADRAKLRTASTLDALCQTARVGVGRSCKDQVSSLAETTLRVRALGTTTLAGWRPYEAPAAPTPSITSEPARDPRDPCPLGDPADLCRCRHELRDTQSGLRQAVSGRCIVVFRRRSSAGG